MPPEPLPWDRKDFVFRDRRHDRGPVDALVRAGAGGSPGSFSSPRWREPQPFRGGGPRDFRAPSPRRPPPGQYKPFLPKEPGAHGCPPPLPPPPDEENFRCYSGRYGSSSGGGGSSSSSGGSNSGSGRDAARREGRGHFQRSPPLNSADTPRRRHDSPLAGCAQRSVTVPQTPPASTSSSSPSHPVPLKDQHDDKAVASVGDGPATGGVTPTTTTIATNTTCDKDRDQDHSLGPIAWKPLKWTRSASFSSSTKTPSRSEQDENGTAGGLPQQQTGTKNPARTQMASPTPSDEGHARKKPRLGWGQGLAKYEKQKVEVPEDSCSGKNTLAQCTTVSMNITVMPCDTSPKSAALPGSASPTTPSSMNYSSSKGVEDRACMRTTSVDVTSNLSDSPCHDSVCSPNDFPLDLEHLNSDSVNHLQSLLDNALQSEDICSGDSKCTGQAFENKLAALKSNVLKALEKTEAEIDMIENDLRASSSQQDKQSKCPSEDDAIPDPVADMTPSSSCSNPVNDMILQSTPPSIEPFQEDISVKQCSDSLEQNIFVNDGTTANIESVDTLTFCNSEFESGLPSSACCDDNKDIIWRVPSTSEDDYMCRLISILTSCNNTSASISSKIFSDLLTDSSKEQCSTIDSVQQVKKKIVKHKRSLLVKERALTLKFRILQHLWREDLHSLCIKKQRSKSQKRGEFGLRPTLNGSQKPRTSRLRLSPQGSSTSLPTREIVDLASKVLSEPGNKMCTKFSSVPCMILDERERRSSELASNKNGLVEDPVSFEKEKVLINPWTDEEKKIFLDNLATYGKDFKKVASFLDHKTTADCIEFYYKNHKSDSFEPVKNILRLKKQERIEQSLLSNDYMVETGKKWKREVSASSLDILGAASVIVARSNSNVRVRPKVSTRPVHGGQYVLKTSSDSKGRARSVESHAEAAAANVLAGICSTISSEGISCITSSVDPAEKVECPVFSEVTQTIDEETCSDEGFGELASGDWTDDEKSLFIRALKMHGKDFAKISHYLGTRSKGQCKIFFSKARKCLRLDGFSQGGGNEQTPSSDANCGKSDLDDVYLAEMDSAMCNIQSCIKVDVDLIGPTGKATDRGSTETVNVGHHSTDQEKSIVDFDVGPSKEESEFVVEVEQSPLKTTDVNLTSENEVVHNERISGADKPAKYTIECKNRSECDNSELDVDSTVLNAQAEPVSFVRPAAPVKHEDIDSQQRDAKKNYFDNGIQVKSEPECLVEAVALKHVDKNGLPPVGSIRNSSNVCNGNVACLVKNDEDSSCDMHAPCLENQLELNPPPLPPNNSDTGPSQKQSSASVLPVDLLGTAFPSVCLEGRPVLPPDYEVSSKSDTSCDKEMEKTIHATMGKLSIGATDQSPSILGGVPLQSSKREKMVADSGYFSLKSAEVDLQTRSAVGTHKPLFRKEIGGSDKNCAKNSLAGYNINPSIHFMPADVFLRSCSQGPGREVEEPLVRTGDVKLFGKILSNPCAGQKSEEAEVKPSTSTPMNDVKHLSSELGSSRNSSRVLHHQTNVNTAPFGLAEQSLTSYGFWDGQIIRSGLPSLPENAMLLSKYPEVLSGMALFQSNDSINASTSTNCFLIHQHRPFAVDDSGQNAIAELPKRNGIEAIPGFQQQGMMAMRVGGNMLVGGGVCTSGISDPVAALKMHYSRQNELLSSGVSTEDSWKDVAGR